VSLYTGSTYQETPVSDYPGHKGLLGRHGVWHFAALRQQFAPGGASKYLSCTRDEESAISDLWFQGRREVLPRMLEGPLAFLYSQNNVTPDNESFEELGG